MIVRFSCSLAAKSASAYDELRNSKRLNTEGLKKYNQIKSRIYQKGYR